MFSYLTGYLKEKSQTFVVIDVSGVGFKVYTSLTSLNDVMTKSETDIKSSNIVSSSFVEKPYKSIIPSFMYK